MDHRTSSPFEQYAATRLLEEREQIAEDWIARLSAQLDLPPGKVLPSPGLLDDVPLVLQKASEFLLVPEPEKLPAEHEIIEEMRNIALLRQRQGWGMEEIVREFDDLAQLLDVAALLGPRLPRNA